MVPDIISLGKAVTSAFSASPDPDTLKEPLAPSKRPVPPTMSYSCSTYRRRSLLPTDKSRGAMMCESRHPILQTASDLIEIERPLSPKSGHWPVPLIMSERQQALTAVLAYSLARAYPGAGRTPALRPGAHLNLSAALGDTHDLE